MPTADGRIALKDLESLTRESIHWAGPRYTPGIDPAAPNLQIKPLVETFDALTYSSSFKAQVATLEAKLRETWANSPQSLRQALAVAAEASALCADLLHALRTQPPGSNPGNEDQIRQANSDIQSSFQSYEDKLRSARAKSAENSEERKLAERQLSEVRDLRDTLENLEEFLSSPAFKAVYNNKLFLRGSWGTGKTHLLCDIASGRLKDGLPTLLVLAQTLPAGNPLTGMFQSAGLGSDVDFALEELDRLGQQSGGRALILIDAINEGDRTAWHLHLNEITALIDRYPNLALALSCRVPFDIQILEAPVEDKFVIATHVGFEDIEFDAQTSFFEYYQIPHPHVPLLATEFSTPLFLKILCTSLQSLSRPSKKRRIASFASGHKGMTKLLEDFVTEVGKSIEKDFKLSPKTCWRILKGQGDTAVAIGIAPKMAEEMDDHITLESATEIASKITGFDSVGAGKLIARLVNDGLLSEDRRRRNSTWVNVIRLPYQRFSDHLISRHLLARYLDTRSSSSIRRCFLPSKPLGKIFKTTTWGTYEMPGLVSAVMLEFPERVKRAVHKNRQELARYLPVKLKTYALSEPFIEGILWRDIGSFSKGTDELVQVFLDHSSTREGMLEALVSLASRSEHRYNAEKLYGYLRGMRLPDRDLFWTEFLRSRPRSSAPHRVLDWVQQSAAADMSAPTARNLITLLSLFLTSTVRPFRDRTTHCLVLLGEQAPGILFAEVDRSFSFNDPYVSERMLAAAYGVLMRTWAAPSDGLAEAALALAFQLSARLVGTESEAPIEHILARDYAQSFVELTAKLVPEKAQKLLSGIGRISSKSMLRRPSRISEKYAELAKPAIRMDFGNYTIGRLVSDRRNYDDSHSGYRAIRRRIERRIVDLGYDAKRFEGVDRSIAHSSFYARQSNDGQRTERYGKKYSWIAFFEVAGRLALRGRLPDRWEPRVSDTDIDPSFPAKPDEWVPPLKGSFSQEFTTAAEWIGRGQSPDYADILIQNSIDEQGGPWVLLDGYISENSPTDNRALFTFLRGLLVYKRDFNRLMRTAQCIEYPGNDGVPRPPEDHYIFAGEIGWSNKYGRQKPQKLPKPYVQYAFEGHRHTKIRKKYKNLSPTERVRILTSDFLLSKSDNINEACNTKYNGDDFVIIEQYGRVPGVRVEIPVRIFSWESYHSEENQGVGASYPAPSIVHSFQLRKFGSQVDMIDPLGKRATIYRRHRHDDSALQIDLLYIRADILQSYLMKRRMSLVWINWGEREMHHTVSERLRNDTGIQALWSKHRHIHKALFVYDSAEGGYRRWTQAARHPRARQR